jgi:eukaryotic-like serine/threonine-protein kinase
MTIANGTHIASYEITGTLGAGGMGEVYRATDTKLKREVALKVLPPDFATDADRLARFQREAELLAALNHNNIAQIHGIESAGGITALIMELIEGPTLAERIEQAQLPPDEALNIALQIVDALEAAHERGIVHRDLKPANIKLKNDGTVKVLDFGIAKAMDKQPGHSGPVSPALTTPAMTQSGMVLGTAAYMSPEQARGKPVDRRADIWAFGCVLYEMLTGQPAFGAEDIPMTLARVLSQPTDMRSLPNTTAPALRHTIELCLEKEPKKRLADISDVRLALKGIIGKGLPAGVVLTDPSVLVSRAGFWLRALPLALALAIVASLGVWFLTRPLSVTQPVNRFAYTVPAEQSFRNTGRNVFALSPDGRRFVYNTNQGLFLRELGELEARLIPGTEETLANPFFSPDGQSVAYRTSGGQLKRIAISGGAPVVIADNLENLNGASWSQDNTILLGQTGGIYRVSANGGTPELIMATDAGIPFSPELLPDGDTLLFTVGPAPGRVLAQSLSTDKRTVLLPGGRDAHYLPSGHLTYVLDGNLFAIAFDPATLTVSGSPVPLVQGISEAGQTWSANYGIANNGTLVYVRGSAGINPRTLVWVDRAGNETPIALPQRNYEWIRGAPDNDRFVVAIDGDLWVSTLTRPALNRLTSTTDIELYPMWTPDSQRVVFTNYSIPGLGWIVADGTGDPETLVKLEGSSLIAPTSWTPDGRSLLFTHGSSTEPRVSILTSNPANDQSPAVEPFLTRDSGAASMTISPDGNWVAYYTNDTGQWQVYIERFPALGNRQLVSDVDGGWGPLWSPDGSELYYRRWTNADMMSVAVQNGPNLTLGTPELLFKNNGYYPNVNNSSRPWGMTSDGRFLFIKDENLAASNANTIVIVENWTEELKRLVPVEQ